MQKVLILIHCSSRTQILAHFQWSPRAVRRCEKRAVDAALTFTAGIITGRFGRIQKIGKITGACGVLILKPAFVRVACGDLRLITAAAAGIRFVRGIRFLRVVALGWGRAGIIIVRRRAARKSNR